MVFKRDRSYLSIERGINSIRLIKNKGGRLLLDSLIQQDVQSIQNLITSAALELIHHYKIDVSLSVILDKEKREERGSYNFKTNEIIIYNTDIEQRFLNLNQVDSSLLVLCHELGHKADPYRIKRQLKKAKLLRDLEELKVKNFTVWWVNFLNLIIGMELTAWERGRKYVPPHLREKYNQHNELNIYTYLSKYITMINKLGYDLQPIVSKLAKRVKMYVDALTSNELVQNYLKMLLI